jgi:hypothetical protein
MKKIISFLEIVVILEMIGPPQSSRDRILWILTNHGGKDGQKQAETVLWNEVRLPKLDPGRAGQGRQDTDFWRNNSSHRMMREN